MATAGVTIPGVMAEKTLAEMFAELYTARHNTPAKVDTNQRIYELTEVNPAIPKAPIRLATERDMSFLPYWTEGFYQECGYAPRVMDSNPQTYRYHIKQGRLYIMEDGGTPVTMAKISRDLETLCVIAFVYTPPYFRKKGYATACVAAISQLALNRGFTKCVLYTDLSNPTSNSIYQKIGYKPICDSLLVKFD